MSSVRDDYTQPVIVSPQEYRRRVERAATMGEVEARIMLETGLDVRMWRDNDPED